DGVKDLLPGARCHGRVTVLQVYLRDLQVHADVLHGFILRVNEPLRFVLVAGGKALALVKVRIKATVSVTTAAKHKAVTFHTMLRVMTRDLAALGSSDGVLPE